MRIIKNYKRAVSKEQGQWDTQNHKVKATTWSNKNIGLSNLNITRNWDCDDACVIGLFNKRRHFASIRLLLNIGIVDCCRTTLERDLDICFNYVWFIIHIVGCSNSKFKLSLNNLFSHKK